MVKIVSEDKLRHLAGKEGFNLIYLEKDYFLTLFLYLIRKFDKIYLKGGTALNKIILNHIRLSEDLDFSTAEEISEVEETILSIINKNKDIFPKYEFDNKSKDFFRLNIFYKSYFSKKDNITLDVNRKSTVYLKTKSLEVPHFYNDLPDFKIPVVNPKEIFAEKVRALITRNQPRDYFDVYMILENGYKIDYGLVKKKLKDAGEEFDVDRIFKNARKIYSRWDSEIKQLTNNFVEYEKVIKKLQKEFGYKE